MLRAEYNLTADGLCPSSRVMPYSTWITIPDEEIACSIPLAQADLKKFQEYCNQNRDPTDVAEHRDRRIGLVLDVEHDRSPPCWAWCHQGKTKGSEDWIKMGDGFHQCYEGQNSSLVPSVCAPDKIAKDDGKAKASAAGRSTVGTMGTVLILALCLCSLV